MPMGRGLGWSMVTRVIMRGNGEGKQGKLVTFLLGTGTLTRPRLPSVAGDRHIFFTFREARGS